MRAPFICSLLAGVLLLDACAVPLPTQSADVRDIGFITGFQVDDPHLSVPDSVKAGAPFAVGVRTYGNSCVTRHSTQLMQEASKVTVVPFDFTLYSTCEDILRTLDHTATVRFNARGTAHVVVRGRDRASGAVVTFERQVVVY